MRVKTDMVSAGLAAKCTEIGTHFAATEFGNAQDAGDRRKAWTRGTFEGESIPVPDVDADSDEAGAALYEACEQLIDDAASAEWERLWDAVPSEKCEDCGDMFAPKDGFCADDMTMCGPCALKYAETHPDAQEACGRSF